ncbi:MAG: PASTA domain-containing protein [Oscillospiraceae bacterium]|nr:PASTA domain-containing protein [Oscillospiraceae bacterium]
MKGIDFIDALSQIDPALADSILNGAPAAEQKTGSGIAVTKAAAVPAEHPRRLKLLSAAGVLGSMAACAALVFGFWKLAAPEPASTEQSSEVSVISLDADSTDDSAAEVTTAAVTEKVTVTAAAKEEKASANTTAAPKQAAADTTKAAAQNTNSAQNAAPTSGKTNKTAAQTTAKPAQTTAKNDDMLTVPKFVGLSADDVLNMFGDIFMINPDHVGYSDYDSGIVYEQSVPEGTKIPVNEVIYIKTSLGFRPDEQIPDVLGMNYKDAVRQIMKAGYTPLDMWSNFTEEPYGTVFRMKENDQGDVVLYVSNGAGGKMPDLVGMTYSDAYDMYCNTVDFAIAGYVPSDQREGTILEQSVEPGSNIKRDFDFDTPRHDRTRVFVTLAGSGSLLEPVDDMPDMVGKYVSVHAPGIPEELETISYSDVAIEYVFDETSDAPAGTVVSQFPAPGEPVWDRGMVTLFISQPEKGEYVSLPDLTGKSVDEAIGLIRDQECEPILGKHVYRPDLPDFTVIETVPGDLSSIRKGSGVRLTVSVSKRQMADPE